MLASFSAVHCRRCGAMQVQYRDRVEDIRLLKLKINDLKRALQILKRQTSNIDVLRNEVHQLQREVLSERTKVKALSEELENPMNVHRWRKLEGSDPGTLEMIQKIQTLQKRLIAKTEEVVEKDLLIQEKDKLYVASLTHCIVVTLCPGTSTSRTSLHASRGPRLRSS